MNRLARLLLAATLACTPWLVHAQGFKCKQADGSVSYQDHACPASTASSSAISTDMSMDIGLPPLTGLDPGCQSSVHHAVSTCIPGIDTTIKRCWQQSLTPRCYLQVTAGPGSRRDSACVQAAIPCAQNGLNDAKRCVQRELPQACMAQLRGWHP